MTRNLSQSVLRSASLDLFPIVESFIRFRSPGRYYSSFISTRIGVDHREFDAVYQTDGVYAILAMVKPIVYPLDRRPFENSFRIPKEFPWRRMFWLFFFSPQI
jgi:hypothetical protein